MNKLIFVVVIFQQLMASRSDALFRDAKSKLLEIRAQHSKRLDARLETREEKRKKKKQKKSSDGHAWTWFWVNTLFQILLERNIIHKGNYDFVKAAWNRRFCLICILYDKNGERVLYQARLSSSKTVSFQ